MSESKHTPGPWYFSKDPEAKDVIYALNGFEWEEICKMIGRNYKANVALIADAWQLPNLRREIKELKTINKEMLDVLKASEELQGDVLMEVSTSQRIFNAMVEYNGKLNKVLRKARGETE